MANTYSQIYIHLVFAVKNREALIPAMLRRRIHSYIGGVTRDLGHTPIAIGGTDNHVHLLIGYNITKLIPDLMREVKTATTNFINANHLIPFRFAWQRGYACFSYSHSHIPKVVAYINSQIEHHKGMTFLEEFKRDLDLRGIEYDVRYLFDDIMLQTQRRYAARSGGERIVTCGCGGYARLATGYIPQAANAARVAARLK